jgi:hypothetical protein
MVLRGTLTESNPESMIKITDYVEPERSSIETIGNGDFLKVLGNNESSLLLVPASLS